MDNFIPNFVEVEENNNYITNYQHTSSGNYNMSDKINAHHQFNPLEYIPSQNQGLSAQAQQSLNFSMNPYNSSHYNQFQNVNQPEQQLTQHQQNQGIQQYRQQQFNQPNQYGQSNFNQQQNLYNNKPASSTQQVPIKYGIDTNDAMNARVFNQDCFLQSSLVPVDKQHIYSRNLFQEGTPIPYDQQEYYNKSQQNVPQINNQYNQGYQIKKKTLYKNELNERMQNISPLSNKLYAPIDGLNQHDRFQIATNQQQIYNKREELNNRISSFQPMPSAQPLSDGEVDVGARPIPQMSL